MLALYRSGRQAEALHAFRETRSAFVEQLGIEPGAELQELHARSSARKPGSLRKARANGRRGRGRDPPRAPGRTGRPGLGLDDSARARAPAGDAFDVPEGVTGPSAG